MTKKKKKYLVHFPICLICLQLFNWNNRSRSTTKPAQWPVRPASAQSDQSSLCASWVAQDPRFLHADREDSEQTGWSAWLCGHSKTDRVALCIVFCFVQASTVTTSVLQLPTLLSVRLNVLFNVSHFRSYYSLFLSYNRSWGRGWDPVKPV